MVNKRLYLLKYNTYFDRIYKREDDISGYFPYILYDSTNKPGIFDIDFKPKDGVNSEQIVNWTGPEPNYIVIYDIETQEISSRWFVMEYSRILTGQYNMSLQRDVIADNFENISNATAYINKAIIPDDNPFIYNQEAITTNQIKSAEIELKDDTKSAWIVGYIARNYMTKSTAADNNTLTLQGSSIYYDFTADSLSSWSYYKYINTPFYRNGYLKHFDFQTLAVSSNEQVLFRDGVSNNSAEKITGTSSYRFTTNIQFNKWVSNNYSDIINIVNTYYSLYDPHPSGSSSTAMSILNLDGKILRTGTSESTYKYYRIHIDNNFIDSGVRIDDNKSGDYLKTYLETTFNNSSAKQSGNSPLFRIVFSHNTLQIELTEISINTYTLNFPWSVESTAEGEYVKRNTLIDAPYDMFAIPYTEDITFTIGANENLTFKKDVAIQVAQSLAKEIGTNLYDLQLLPYCPFGGYDIVGNDIKLSDYSSNSSKITRINTPSPDNSIISCLVWCTTSSGTKNIVLDTPLTYSNKKLENQCNTYRLVSPNYNGQFDFNLAKNNTPSLDTFNVDYTYIPYNPYIHINPIFSGLYGKDYNDSRGLICGGDFSIAYLSDAWKEYQIQNKNYQNIFDRETQNLEVQHKYQMAQSGISAITNSISGAFSGGIAGSFGSIGTGKGSLIGSTASLAGGIADQFVQSGIYKENMKYRKDIFSMQLENIQALPYSLAKNTAYTYNNKIFPILEFYTCTEEEKRAIAQLIANSSMTINTIGTISDYLYSSWSYNDIKSRGYLSCNIIKIGNISSDSHMQYTIADEMEKGIYFGGN